MSENEKFLFVTTCAGTLQNIEPPVSISIAHNIDRIYPTVACPFAKEVYSGVDRLVKCVGPSPEVNITEKKALKLNNCYQLQRKG